MSHQPERKERNCLNCGATVIGRYCHVCGQENTITKMSFWALIRHFIYDLFHFDGKFFDSVKNLFIKPGVIAREYTQGKRTRYLEPVRMYLFTSAVFFLIFSTLEVEHRVEGENYLEPFQRMEIASGINQQLKSDPSDSMLRRKLNILLDTAYRIRLDSSSQLLSQDSIVSYNGKTYIMKAEPRFRFSKYLNVANGSSKGWLSGKINSKVAELNMKYGDNVNEALSRFLDVFLHRLPYLLFISLPFFAGILKLLYVNNKSLYYSDHAVFTLYHYILSFLILMLNFLLNFAAEKTGWAFFRVSGEVILLAWPVYLFIEMKHFYGQKLSKTFGKFLLLNMLGIIVILILFILFFFFSLLQI